MKKNYIYPNTIIDHLLASDYLLDTTSSTGQHVDDDGNSTPGGGFNIPGRKLYI